MTWDTRKFFGDPLIADNPDGFDSITFSGTPDYFSVALTWGTLPDEYWADVAYYEIWGQRYTQSGYDSDYVLIDTVGANVLSYTDRLLEANKTDYYKLRAVFLNGQVGNWIGPINVTTLAYTPDVYATWADSATAKSLVNMVALKPAGEDAIQVGGYSTAVANLYAGQSVTIDKPSGVEEEDVMILRIQAGLDSNVSVPAGWVAFPNSPFSYTISAHNGYKLYVFYKIAGSLEPDDYAVTLLSTYIEDYLTLELHNYSNVDNDSPLDCGDATQYNSANSNILDAPDIYLSTPGALIIPCFIGWPSVDHTINPPSGYTEDVDWRDADTHYARIEICHLVWSP
jgi:hypothetical protein